MTMLHRNRIRRINGKQVDGELEAVEAGELDDCNPTEAEVRQRAHEIYLSRNGEPGNSVMDWLQAEIELLARKAKAHSN